MARERVVDCRLLVHFWSFFLCFGVLLRALSHQKGTKKSAPRKARFYRAFLLPKNRFSELQNGRRKIRAYSISGISSDFSGTGEKETPHATRHTYTYRAVKEGLAPEMLQKILGHANYSTTANIYTHIDAETLANAVTNALLTNAESGKKEKP